MDMRCARAAAADGMTTQPPEVLLIEDDEPPAGILSAHLQTHPYRVTVA